MENMMDYENANEDTIKGGVGSGMNMGSGPEGPDTPSFVPESPGRGIKRSLKYQGGPPNPSRKKPPQPQTMSPMTPNPQMGPSPPMHPQMQGVHMGYSGPGGGMYPMQSGPPPSQNPQWGGYGQQGPQGGPNFYSQQVPPTPVTGPGSKFDCPGNTSKQALSNMLCMRLPTNQYMGQTSQQPNMNPNLQPMPKQQFIRRGQHNVLIQSPQQNTPQIYPTQQPTQMYSNMQQSMNLNDGGYVGQRPGMRPYMQNQTVPMNPMIGPQYPAPPYPRPNAPNQQALSSQYHQQLSQQHIRHIMAMQQQQHHMQRQMQNPQPHQDHIYGLQPPPY